MPNIKPYYFTRVPLTKLEHTCEDVCRAIGFPSKDMRLRTTNGPAVQARRLVVWILRRATHVPFNQIAAFFGKDHSTLVHADGAFSDVLKKARTENPAMRREVAQLLRAVYRTHQKRMKGDRAPRMPALVLGQLVYVGRLYLRAKNRSLIRLKPHEVSPEPSPLSSVAWHDTHYNGTAQGFFKLQNDRAVEHMRKALQTEQKERLSK